MTAWIRIEDVHHMAPFLASVVSPSDHWMYASSSGGLAAGRVNAEGSLFPYWTDDRLHQTADIAGPWTALQVHTEHGTVGWEPLRPRATESIRRHLHKSVAGDRLRYVEEHRDLGLTFTMTWGFSEAFGLVRRVELASARDTVDVDVADGLIGVLPAGAPLGLVQTASCLVNAYGRSEWDGSMALFSLEAMPSDKAEPAESLRANVAWCTGLEVRGVALSDDQLDAVARGFGLRHETTRVGRPGAFIVSSRVRVAPDEPAVWYIAADVGKSHAELAALSRTDRSAARIEHELDATTAAMDGILADVDGLQHTADATADAHHRANALFNAMRGGVPLDEHRVDPADFVRHVRNRSRGVASKHGAWLDSLGIEPISVDALMDAAAATGDANLIRPTRAFLPLWFGRRHGDPSRPWNRFDIRVRDEDGGRRVAWQGNWRDVFQNWEGLLLTYPSFLPGVIGTFLDASTLDGHNPYRITSDGIDWEEPEPDNPWANIGYWGDHSIVYLTRLLELEQAHHPGQLSSWLDTPTLSSADVPYRIRPYPHLVQDARDAIEFDHAANKASHARVAATGEDGRFVHDGDDVLLLGLAEKLAIGVLAKLTSLVPGAGIWLNTQRPEWNDANNALAGPGVSVVTAAQLYRHLGVLADLFADLPDSVEVLGLTAQWLSGVLGVLGSDPSEWTPQSRRAVMDQLGSVGTDVRRRMYDRDYERATVGGADLRALCARGRVWLADALAHAKRPDGLYDGYDTVQFAPGEAHVSRLYPMLEGQVALLSAGFLSPEEAADLIDQMYASALYREDVYTFLLYPDRRLPGFWEKNRVDPSLPGVADALASGDLLVQDAGGTVRFAPDLQNAGDVARSLDARGASAETRTAILHAWEATFDHQSFTGRSGTMHAYEGLGSVYWHMVGKLLVAAQETLLQARQAGADPGVVARLSRQVGRIRHGLGCHRTAAEFGAFHTDPYSHTPKGRGAQQPGMTGLVKEELIARRNEVGARVVDGVLSFDLTDLLETELLNEPSTWTVPSGVRAGAEVDVPANAVGVMLYGVPTVIEDSETERIVVDGVGGFEGLSLDRETSQRIFARDAAITGMHVYGRVRR